MTERSFHMELSEVNRVGRHWDAQRMCVAIYAARGRAVVNTGLSTAAYTDPAQVRELAAFLLAAADRMES